MDIKHYFAKNDDPDKISWVWIIIWVLIAFLILLTLLTVVLAVVSPPTRFPTNVPGVDKVYVDVDGREITCLETESSRYGTSLDCDWDK